jgi:hypothetical protein
MFHKVAVFLQASFIRYLESQIMLPFTKILVPLLAVPICLLASCSFKTNKVVKDLYSSNKRYHVEVRECNAAGSLVATDTEQWADVMEAGKSGSCQSSVGTIIQFKVPHPEDKLDLEWASNTLLKASHPNFNPSYGPEVRSGSSADDPVKVIYAQKKY